jgi:two-component system, chemotaxis family, protein-glutamate methylesterase/glutaminase
MGQIRVLIADDSLTVRKRLCEVLSRQPDLTVVAEACNGREAVDLCERFRPNVVTMDMMMPEMNGVAATEYIMAYCPTPILVISVSDDEGQVLNTFDALAAGAVDFLEKPSNLEYKSGWENAFIAAVRLISRIRPIIHPRRRLPYRGLEDSAPSVHNAAKIGTAIHGPERLGSELVAIGASAGGPSALATILAQMPPEFPVPILLVVHISAEFAKDLTTWLGRQSALTVRVAVDGEPLPTRGSCEVLMPPPDRHLELCMGRLRVTDTPALFSCRPSIDVLFRSVARESGPRSIGCLLTGMGTDGALGLLAIRRSGGQTIAQDQGSSTVFGMPKAAIDIGAAEIVAPLGSIAQAMATMVAAKRAA